MKRKKGQVLVLVLLVVVVALAIGLSVASRNLTNLKTATQTENTQRAFTAAEGGVEDVLTRIDKVASVALGGGQTSPGCSRIGTTTSASCDIASGGNTLHSTVKVTAVTSFERTIEPGDVGQINLDGNAATNIVVEFAKKNTDEVNSKPSIELSVICFDLTSSNCLGFTNIIGNPPNLYSRRSFAYQIDSSRAGESGFLSCNNTITTLNGANTIKCDLSTSVDYVGKITLAGGPFNAGTGSNLKLLRIKPFGGRMTVRVSASGCSGAGCVNMPVQNYELDSSATTDLGITRRVQVTRSALPQLPAVFDYALYSENDILK